MGGWLVPAGPRRYRIAHDLVTDLREHWRDRLGDDDENTRAAANYAARALRNMGRYGEARDLDEDTLARSRRVLGEDNSHTLTSASNLAIDLRNLGRSDWWSSR